MSLQPKTEKTEAHVRRAGGRSSGGGHQQHPPSGGGGVGGHGPHNSSNTSAKRSNGPGGQFRVNPNAGSLQSNASVKVQNGSPTQRHQAGQATALSGNAPLPAPKQSNVIPPRSNGILPKPPMSQPSNIKSSEQTSAVTTAAISGENNRSMLQQPIAFQFGSFSPVSINGFQIPARTSSAPPNFDEQKRDQARSVAATDVPGAILLNALSGTPQRQQTHPGSKQGASTLDHSAEGKRIQPGTKPGVSATQRQELPGGRKPSSVVLKSSNPSSSQVVGVVPVSPAPSPYLQSQNAPSGPRAPNSQHQSQGLAAQLHMQSSQFPLQGATPGLHAHNSKVQSQSAVPTSQLQSQGNTGLHAPSAQLQSQVVTAGPYVPNSQLQSQALAPGSRPLQVPIQMPQGQQAFGSQGLPTGALRSQGMLHHSISFAQPMQHMMQQQVNTHISSQQFIAGNTQMNAQIPIQINPQLTSSIGAHLPQYVSSSQTNQYNIPQRTSTVKITHPETHEELKFGPKGVKSDSHADNGVTLVSDSNPLPGSLPPYGPTQSSSIPVSGLQTKNFYPSVSAVSYGHPSFQHPPKTTTTARPTIVRPSTGQNSASINQFGVNVDLSKQPSNAMDSSSASATLSSHSSHGSNISTIVAAKKEEIQPEIHGAKVSVSNRSDAGTKQSMPVTSPINPSDVVVSNSSAVSGGNNHVNEDHNAESGKPIGVPMKEQPRKVIKSDIKYKRQQNQQASLLRTSSNAQAEFKAETVAESFESGGSYPEPDKCNLSQSKHKKQHQQQALLRSSSNARAESKKEVVTDSSEAVATCTEADKFDSATVSLKTAKPVDGGPTPELARKAIETVLHSSSLDMSSVSQASSNVPSNFSKVEKIISMSSSANTSNISGISSSGVIGDLQPPFIDPSASVQHSEYGQGCAIVAAVTSDVQEEALEVMNKFYVEKAQEEKEFTEEKVNSDNLVTAGNSMSNKPVPESDSNNRDEEKLHLGSESNSDIETCTNSDQSANRECEYTKITLEGAKNESNVSPDLLSLPVNSSTRNEKSQLLNEEVRGNATKDAHMVSQCPEFDNGTVDQNLVKDKTEEAFQSEEKVSRPVQSGLSSGDDIVDSDQSAAHASKSGVDTFTRLEDVSLDVMNLSMQDKAQVLIHNNSGSEGMTPSLQLLSRPVESEGKSDSLGKVQEKEIKSSSNALSNSKSTNAGDVPKLVVNKKKKLKDLLSKADAAAPTGDLYNAYKVPEKQEDVNTLEPCNVVTAFEEIPPLKETEKQVPKEVDDWEDAAELSTNVKQVTASIAESDRSGDRRYSRDFLLTFRAQFKDLPPNFEFRQDIKDLMDNQSVATHRGEGELSANMGRAPDAQWNGNSRLEDRRMKPTDAFTGGRDMRMEVGGSSGGFRPNQGHNTGFGKNMRGQATGILPSGSFVQASYPQGGLTRNNSDVDRWQRGSAFQKGVIPPPPAPLPVIHRTENPYEVRKVSDEEELKQRKIKAILNKLTPQNFDKLFLKVQEVNIDSADCLAGVISQIFDKALMEPTFCEMYAKFCYQLAAELPEIYKDNEKVTFRRGLLNKCQEEFERDEREQAEAQNAEDGEIKLSKEELEEKRIATRRRMLGNIRFIGELFKESMLTERIMHDCIKKLLGEYENPDEENVEALCKLMSTIGHMIDRTKAKDYMDYYFVRITQLASNQVLPSRLRFMLKDVIDLRKNGWQQRRKVDGPKKIEEVHRDAAQERQAAAMGGRLNRTPSMGHSGRRVSTPPDHGSRGPPMQPFMAGAASGSMSHMSGMRGSQAQTGGRGFQDARVGERIMPLPQRSSDDGHLTLGPQGGLARGISGRAQPLSSNRSVLADGSSLSSGSNRRASLASRDEISSRTYTVEKSMLTKSGIPERNVSGSDRREYQNSYSFNDKGGRAPIAEQEESSHGVSSSQLIAENLAKNSNMTIKEFYSSRDMDEAALCVTDLKSPLFHPTLVSLWITDSFDRKDIERDLLGNLLTHLNRTVPVVLSEEHLIKGLDNVLASLEDSVVDAPKAPQFLGRILGKLVIADIFSLEEVAVLLEKGGADPGSLLEEGLALDVLGTVLEFIREKDDKTLLDLYKSSGVRLEGFMPRKKPVKVESFLEKKNIQCLSRLISRHL